MFDLELPIRFRFSTGTLAADHVALPRLMVKGNHVINFGLRSALNILTFIRGSSRSIAGLNPPPFRFRHFSEQHNHFPGGISSTEHSARDCVLAFLSDR